MSQLVDEAMSQGLHGQREWHVLLHYKGKGSGVESLIDDPVFFLSEDGKKDPSAELQASIRGFFMDAALGDEHPRCRFPARYAWLEETLGMDEAMLPRVRCPRLDDAVEKMSPQRATLVFPAEYMNSPASMFGHTLVRIDQGTESKLLSHAVNYSARAVDTNGLLYAFKGIFGFYRGYYSILPYYEKVEEYGDIERRDMWEYELSLTRAEVLMMALHIWELKDVYSWYYFFDENCSYNLLFLLEAARPSLDLVSGFKVWATPTDTVRAIRDAGLVQSVVYRPSRATMIGHMSSFMDNKERKAAVLVARGEYPPEDVLRDETLGNEEKIVILDAATEYLQVLYSEKRVAKEEYLKTFLSALKARGSLGKAGEGLYEPPLPARPDEGHSSRRMGIAVGSEDMGPDDDEPFLEFSFRPAYHGLLDPVSGYAPGSQIEFLDAALRYHPSQGKVSLERLDLIDIVSLAGRDEFFKPRSWKVRTGFSRKALHDARDHSVYLVNPGGGFALDSETFGLIWAMFETELDVSGAMDESFSAGGGVSIGLLKDFRGFSNTALAARAMYHVLGDEHRSYEVRLEESLRLSRNQGLRMEVSGERSFGDSRTQAMLGWYFYF